MLVELVWKVELRARNSSNIELIVECVSIPDVLTISNILSPMNKRKATSSTTNHDNSSSGLDLTNHSNQLQSEDSRSESVLVQ
jgi:hypothetical protein